MGERREYNIHLPLKRLYEIQEMVKSLPESNEREIRDKRILEMIFIMGFTTKDVEEKRCFFSNRWLNHHRIPLSQRRIQEIIDEYVPDYRSCRKKKKKYSDEYYKIRAEQAKIKKTMKQECNCCHTTTGKLELHHIIPVILGGTNDKRNIELLCSACHREKTNYLKLLLSNGELKKITYKQENTNDKELIPGQLEFPF